MASDKTERITLPTWCCTVRPQAEFLRKLRRPLLLTNKQFRNLLLNGTIVGYKSMICTRGRTHTVLIHLGIIVNGDYGAPRPPRRWGVRWRVSSLGTRTRCW